MKSKYELNEQFDTLAKSRGFSEMAKAIEEQFGIPAVKIMPYLIAHSLSYCIATQSHDIQDIKNKDKDPCPHSTEVVESFELLINDRIDLMEHARLKAGLPKVAELMLNDVEQNLDAIRDLLEDDSWADEIG